VQLDYKTIGANLFLYLRIFVVEIYALLQYLLYLDVSLTDKKKRKKRGSILDCKYASITSPGPAPPEVYLVLSSATFPFQPALAQFILIKAILRGRVEILFQFFRITFWQILDNLNLVMRTFTKLNTPFQFIVIICVIFLYSSSTKSFILCLLFLPWPLPLPCPAHLISPAYMAQAGAVIMYRCVQSALTKGKDHRYDLQQANWEEVLGDLSISTKDLHLIWLLMSKQVRAEGGWWARLRGIGRCG